MRLPLVFIGFSLLLSSQFAYAGDVRQSNPLYIPEANTFYNQLSFGTHVVEFQDGTSDDDMYSVSETLGYGITDRFSIEGQFAYTHDESNQRSGLSVSQLTSLYRVFPTTEKSIMDVYGTFDFDGGRRYKGTWTPHGFNTINFSTGRYGVGSGFRTGKTDGTHTLVGYGEIMYRFGDQKSRITDPVYTSSLFTADIEETLDWVLGIKTAYETGRWAINFDFSYHQYDSTVITDISSTDPGLRAAVIGSQYDHHREWIFGLSSYYSFSKLAQLGLYGNYVNDNYHNKRYQMLDYTIEYGLLFNIQF